MTSLLTQETMFQETKFERIQKQNQHTNWPIEAHTILMSQMGPQVRKNCHPWPEASQATFDVS